MKLWRRGLTLVFILFVSCYSVNPLSSDHVWKNKRHFVKRLQEVGIVGARTAVSVEGSAEV